MHSRAYQEGDETAILELFKTVHGRELSEALWEWRFIKNPGGRAVTRLMFEGNKLVGHYAIVPTLISYQGEAHKAGFSLTTMTHPRYRGRAIFTQLANEVYQNCEQEGFQLIYGFPNANSYYGFTHRLGWSGLGHVHGWIIDNEPRIVDLVEDFVFEELERCGPEIDIFLKRVRDETYVSVPRTAAFVQWRYLEKPGNDYTVYCIRNKEKSLEGLVVYKLFQGSDEVAGHIIDFMTIDNPGLIVAIIKRAYDFFRGKGVRKISCWTYNDEVTNRCLESAGYRKIEWPTYFGVKMLNYMSIDQEKATDIRNWRFTMGDSDVF